MTQDTTQQVGAQRLRRSGRGARVQPRPGLSCCTSAAATSGGSSSQPGWRWSEHVKPIAGTELLRGAALPVPRGGHAPHQDRRRRRVRRHAGPGHLPAGRARRLGGRRREVVIVDWWGASNYAK